MAYSLVGRSAPMAADDSDDDDAYLDGGEDDVRERTAWQDKHQRLSNVQMRDKSCNADYIMLSTGRSTRRTSDRSALIRVLIRV